MKLVLNIQKKHLTIFMVFVLIIIATITIATNWDTSPSHDTLWTMAIKGKNVDSITVYDDLVISSGKGISLGGVRMTNWPTPTAGGGDCIEVSGSTPVPDNYKLSLSSIQATAYQPYKMNECIDKCTDAIKDCSQYPLGPISWVSQPISITGIQCIQNCRTADIICPIGKNAQADIYTVLYTSASWNLYCK